MRVRAFIFLLFLYGNSAPAFQPEVLKQLWDIPTSEVAAKTVRAYSQGSIRVEEVFYSSRPYKRNPVKIFGYYCYPSARSGKLPAILLSHGGGGTASLPRAIEWASRGYAVLAIDLPGKGENRTGSRSSGPDMIVSNLLRTQPDLSYNYLVHAVAAARNGITYLSQRREVDPGRIAMVGLSWGGVITLLTNGQDNRLKAAVNVFGAGYIPEGCTWDDHFTSMPAFDKELWNTYLDPKNFLSTQHAPILFITGTNDHCYYLPTFQKSYEEVKSPKNIVLVPNLRHRFLSSSQTPAFAWLNQKLKKGGTFPEVAVLPPFQKDTEKIVIPVKAVAHSRVESVCLYYSSGGPQEWTEKTWKELRPYRDPADGLYYFALPTLLISPEITFYVNVKDNHGGASSSLARSLFPVALKNGTKTFAVSSPVKKTFRHEKPITLLNGTGRKDAYFYFSSKDNAYRFYDFP